MKHEVTLAQDATARAEARVSDLRSHDDSRAHEVMNARALAEQAADGLRAEVKVRGRGVVMMTVLFPLWLLAATVLVVCGAWVVYVGEDVPYNALCFWRMLGFSAVVPRGLMWHRGNVAVCGNMV